MNVDSLQCCEVMCKCLLAELSYAPVEFGERERFKVIGVGDMSLPVFFLFLFKNISSLGLLLYIDRMANMKFYLLHFQHLLE